MIQITIPASEYFDSNTNEFHESKETVLTLEHSLVSISKWESKWKKPFLSKNEKTEEESLDYIKCMTISKNIQDEVYYLIPINEMKAIQNYIEDEQTATTFNNKNDKKSKEIITSEIIYYWMVSYNIPFECQKWHLNRLLALINVCNIKNAPQKKMSKKELAARNRSLNAARKQQLNNKG